MFNSDLDVQTLNEIVTTNLKPLLNYIFPHRHLFHLFYLTDLIFYFFFTGFGSKTHGKQKTIRTKEGADMVQLVPSYI